MAIPPQFLANMKKSGDSKPSGNPFAKSSSSGGGDVARLTKALAAAKKAKKPAATIKRLEAQLAAAKKAAKGGSRKSAAADAFGGKPDAKGGSLPPWLSKGK